MTFRRASLWFVPVVALSALAVAAAVRKPQVEPGLHVAKSGRVLDAQTGQPLPGAYVVVRWLEQSGMSAASDTVDGRCLYRTIVRTDDQGRYAVPAVGFAIAAERSFGEHRYFWDSYGYAPGHDEVGANRSRHPIVAASTLPAVQELEPILLAAEHVSPSQRVAELADSLRRFSCEPYAKELGAVADEIYAEARTAACSPQPDSEAAQALSRLAVATAGAGSRAPACAQFPQASNRQ